MSSVATLPGVKKARSRGDDERSVGVFQRAAERLDGASVDLAVLHELREVVDEGAVDHAVRLGRAAAQAFEILEIAALNFCARSRKGLGARLRTRKTEHLMARRDQFLDDGGANKPVAPVTKTRIATSLLFGLTAATASAAELLSR